MVIGGGETGLLGAENELVVETERCLVVTQCGVGGERPSSWCAVEGGDGRVDGHVGEFVVVKARPTELGIIEVETERFDQRERGADVGAKADDIASVGGNLWSDENDLHATMVP